MGKKRITVYYRFVQQMLRAVQIAHVRHFPHKHDPRKYGVWPHAVLFALKQVEDKTYRFIVDMIAEMPYILALLQINEAPHETTMHKAVKRMQGSFVNQFVAVFVQRRKSERVRAGINKFKYTL